jgi:hypothetical protein
MKHITRTAAAFGWLLALHPAWAAQKSAAPAVDFNRDIRPIFSEHCYACHGPDEGKRKAGLRLDQQEVAFGVLKSGERAIVPGDLQKSALVRRIQETNEDDIMPPVKTGKPLTKAQIALLKAWVGQGAHWEKHWSFIPPKRPPLPLVKDKKWARNGIDQFILARLEAGGLKPNPEADKATLIRRVTLDLTGLPPTIAEVDAFLADRSPDAYEKLVDRLLHSPHYGERMAQEWLDLARYADTSGYHFDGVRFMWLWRDWVINVFNENKRFDEFTVEQLAGDLLPDATPSQRLATGFVRNNMTNDEGGADPDEYLSKYVVDRVDTLGTVWLGLTVGCAECHDHKYDPIKNKEFYQLYAFFHNVPEKGLDRIRTDNPPPRLPMPTPEQARAFVEADFTLKDAEKTLQDRINELGETQEKWERETEANPPPPLSEDGLEARVGFDGTLAVEATPGAPDAKFVGTNNLDYSDGRMGKCLKLDGQSRVEAEIKFDQTNAFSLGVWIRAENGTGCILSKQGQAPATNGFDLVLRDSRVELGLRGTNGENSLVVRTKERLPQKQWEHVLASYDGSGKAAGMKVYVNGKPVEVETQKDKLEGPVLNDQPIHIGDRSGELNFTGLIDDLRMYRRVVPAEEARLLVFHGFLGILAKSRGHRTDEERNDLARYYKENQAVDYLRAEAALGVARKTKEDFYTTIPTSLIMEEMQPPRETYVLVRGDFRHKGERVYPNTPACLPPLPAGPTNRLSLARWLVSEENPLTARVAVNRYWAVFFGTGLVKTAKDFGSQGEWPSHPELLDWLAVQFRDGDEPHPGMHHGPTTGPWDVKGLVRLIVTSATYRQAATVSPQKLERDPYNRLLARGPRLRLEAEFVRDNALAVSGLLNPKIGGPSIKPYQPPGIWDGVDASYQQDHGDALYRRGLYVFWRRSAHYPSFATFDAPSREVCTCVRQRTQTPLQSLVLMNDPAYVEAARGLAQRVLHEEPSDLNKQLVRAFRHTLGRMPRPDEIELLRKTYQEEDQEFRNDSKAAESLLKVGELKAPEHANEADLAAMTAVANVLLNLNETITK